ncbi:MAG TPA: tyrosine-type recombinase/integrase [Gemmatimonadaceae bacterium]
MTDAKRQKAWSYSTGERGKNRVRAFAHAATGRIFLEYYEQVGRGLKPKICRVALGACERDRAKAAADELAAGLRRADRPAREHVKLAKLFETYDVEVTPGKSLGKQQHDRACAEMFLRAFGAETEARLLSRREWDRFIRDRRSGAIRTAHQAKRRGVRNRVIAYDLQWLTAVLNWATTASNGAGGVLLERNPLKGLALPREASPARPMLSDAEYQAMRGVASEVHPYFELALVLAHDTGHRIGSIRKLRWSDVNLEDRRIQWRADTDKIQFEHTTPVTDDVATVLTARRRSTLRIGDGWIFPEPGNPAQPCDRDTFSWWWEEAERLAGIPHVARRGWHSLRRTFASELKHIPLKDLCELGGWKSADTVIECYIKPDEATMREALAQRKPIRATATR